MKHLIKKWNSWRASCSRLGCMASLEGGVVEDMTREIKKECIWICGRCKTKFTMLFKPGTTRFFAKHYALCNPKTNKKCLPVICECGEEITHRKLLYKPTQTIDWEEEFNRKFTCGGITGVIYLKTVNASDIKFFISELLGKERESLDVKIKLERFDERQAILKKIGKIICQHSNTGELDGEIYPAFRLYSDIKALLEEK